MNLGSHDIFAHFLKVRIQDYTPKLPTFCSRALQYRPDEGSALTAPARGNLGSRLGTVAIAAPILLGVLFYGPAWGWFAIVLLTIGMATWELMGMTHPDDRIARGAVTLASLSVAWVVYHHTQDARLLFTVLLVVPISALMLSLWRLGDLKTAALRCMTSIAAPLYIGGLLCCLALLRKDNGSHGPQFVFLALQLSWLADTGGYFAGRFLGPRWPTKLHPVVSPKKTLIGFYGALLGAVAGALLAWAWYMPEIPLVHYLGLALVAGCLGQFGDLAESMLKRSTGIKDSGTLVPGHGGVLDRVDALIVVSPVLYLYCMWFPLSAS